VIEGNHYFPDDSIKKNTSNLLIIQLFALGKGIASYYTIEVDGATNQHAAWYYHEPKDATKEIKNYVIFWNFYSIMT